MNEIKLSTNLVNAIMLDQTLLLNMFEYRLKYYGEFSPLENT